MHFRYARHTSRIKELERFYIDLLGFEKLGSFEAHDGYQGLFIGSKDSHWMLEFTQADDIPNRAFDDDDLLVFYAFADKELDVISRDLKSKGLTFRESKNSYWNENGVELKDPDGMGVVFSKKLWKLDGSGELGKLLIGRGIKTWEECLEYVKTVRYQRISELNDLKKVVLESCGTCSSKHAFLKKVAEENFMKHVDLCQCVFKMSASNVPSLSKILEENNLEYIPEVHNYLRVHGRILDLTSREFDIYNFRDVIIEEQIVSIEEVLTLKQETHQSFLRNWIEEEKLNFRLEELWRIREDCISAMSNN